MINQFCGFTAKTEQDIFSCIGSIVWAAKDRFGKVIAVIQQDSVIADLELFYDDAKDATGKKKVCPAVIDVAKKLQQENIKECSEAAINYLKNLPESVYVISGLIQAEIKIV